MSRKAIVTDEQVKRWWKSDSVKQIGKHFARGLGAALVAEAINFTVHYVLDKGRVVDIGSGRGSRAA